MFEITGPSTLSYLLGSVIMLAGVVIPLALMVLRFYFFFLLFLLSCFYSFFKTKKGFLFFILFSCSSSLLMSKKSYFTLCSLLGVRNGGSARVLKVPM